MLAMLEVAQTGTLYIYQGEEIGMANVPRSWPIEEYKDVATINYYNRSVFVTCMLFFNFTEVYVIAQSPGRADCRWQGGRPGYV